MKTGVRAAALVVLAATVMAGCQSSGPAARRRPSSPAAIRTPHASAAQLKAALLSADDLPAGFIERPLTSRNLPTDLSGCPRLRDLMARGARPHAQAEFFRPPLGPWIDEAIMQPAHGSANEVASRLAAALSGCGSVTVTEEDQRVRLTLSPAEPPQPSGRTHAWQASGTLRGLRLRMRIVLANTGRSVLLITAAGPRTAGLDLIDRLAGPPQTFRTAT